MEQVPEEVVNAAKEAFIRMNPKRPWVMSDYPPFSETSLVQKRTYATLEAAMAKAIIRCMGSRIGEERLIQNYQLHEAWLVKHIEGYRVLVKKMTWGPDDKWMKQ